MLGWQGPSGGTNCQRQGGQSSNQNHLTHADLWCWLVIRGDPRTEITGSLLNSSLICINRKLLGQVNKKSNSNDKNRESWPLSQLLDLSQFVDPEPLEWRGGWDSFDEGPEDVIRNVDCCCFSQLSPKYPMAFTGVTVHWEKWNNQTLQGLLDTVSELTLIPRDLKHHCGPLVRVRTYGDQVMNGVFSQVCLSVGPVCS